MQAKDLMRKQVLTVGPDDPVADVLSIQDPLTVEVFELREEAVLLGFAFPTPPVELPSAVEAPS